MILMKRYLRAKFEPKLQCQIQHQIQLKIPHHRYWKIQKMAEPQKVESIMKEGETAESIMKEGETAESILNDATPESDESDPTKTKEKWGIAHIF